MYSQRLQLRKPCSNKALKCIGLALRVFLENEVVPRVNIPLHHIQISGLRGKGWQKWLTAPFALMRAVWQAKKLIKTLNPDLVLGMEDL